MASNGWRENGTLKSLVFEHYGRFNVFQLMRLLLWKRAGKSGAKRKAQSSVRLQPALRLDHRLRFKADLSAAFPGREITELHVREQIDGKHGDTHIAGGDVINLSTPNFCVAGTLGPLPEPFTEWVRDLKRTRDHTMEDFLNVFNQRLNVLRFQLKARQTMGLNNLPPEETAQARYLAAMMGMAHHDIAAQVPLPRRAWLGLAGLLSNVRRSGFAVKHVLSEFTGATVELEELVGSWQIIETDNRMALGRNNHMLGRQSVLGRRTWDQQARVRLTLSPISFDAFCRLLPPNAEEMQAKTGMPAEYDPTMPAAFDGFVALIRLLLDRQFDCEVLLEAAPETIPPRLLSVAPPPRSGSYWGLRLGQTAWITGRSGTDKPSGAYRAGYLVRAFNGAETT